MSNTAQKNRNTPHDADKQQDASKRPEAFTLGIGAWILALSVEAIQQILNVVGTAMDNNALLTETKRMAEDRGTELTDGQATVLTYISMAFVGLLGLAIVAILFYFVRKIATRGKNADSLRRLLALFGGYLLFKALLVTFSPPTGNLPVAFYAVSGVAQIIVGVAAVVGAVLLGKKESADWIAQNQDKDDTPPWGRKPGTNDKKPGAKDSATPSQNDSESGWKSLFGKKKREQDSNKDEKAKDSEDSMAHK